MAEVTTIKIRGEDKTSAAFRSANGRLNKLQTNLQKTSAKTAALTGGFSKMAGALGPLIGVAGFSAMARKLLTVGDRLDKMAIQTGLTVEELQALQFAASQSGVATETFNSAMNKFNRIIGETASGLIPEARDAYKTLGISIKDTDGNLKDSSELLLEVADSFGGIKDPAMKAKTATDLFGRAGIDLIPMLQGGAKELVNYETKLRDAGGIMDATATSSMAKFNDSLDLLGRVTLVNFSKILVPLLPALTALAGNFDNIAKFVGIAGTAFIVSKIPAAITGIAVAFKALTVAMAANPIGLIAVGVTTAGTAAYLYSDEISGYFGFAKDAPEELKNTNSKLKETADKLEELNKVEKARVETSDEFAQTTKKKVVPELKNLDAALKNSSIEFKNIKGPEGLGGLQLAFISFFGDLQTISLNTFFDIENIVRETFSFVKQDFREFFQALDNIVIFEGQKVRGSFTALIASLGKSIKELNNEIGTLDINIPGSIFTFRNTFVDVPGTIFNFDSSSLLTASNRIAAITSQVNGIKMERVSINRPMYKTVGYFPFYRKYLSAASETEGYKFSGVNLTGGQNTVSRSTSRSPAASLVEMDSDQESQAPVVNVYLDLEGEVKLPLHDYIVGVQNRAERSGDTNLALIVGGNY